MNIWLLIAGCVVTTVLIKAAGPVVLGGRDLPPVFLRVIACMAPALLAALVVTSAVRTGRAIRSAPKLSACWRRCAAVARQVRRRSRSSSRWP